MQKDQKNETILYELPISTKLQIH